MSHNTRPSRPSSGYDLFRKWIWISGCLSLNLTEYPFAVRVSFLHSLLVYIARPMKWVHKACHCVACDVNGTAEVPPTSPRLKIFSYFFLFQSLFIREGSSRRISPGGLADRIQPGEPSGIVDGRETARRT